VDPSASPDARTFERSIVVGGAQAIICWWVTLEDSLRSGPTKPFLDHEFRFADPCTVDR